MEASRTESDARLKALEAVYGGILEPGRYDAIIDAMNAAFDGWTGDPGDAESLATHLGALEAHVANALRLFEIARPGVPSKPAQAIHAKPFAAMVLARDGRVATMNEAAAALFGQIRHVDELPLRADAHGTVRQFLRTLERAEAQDPVVVHGAHPGDDRGLVFILEVVEADGGTGPGEDGVRPERLALVKTTQTRLSDAVLDLTRTAFGLSAAERDVVRQLAGGLSLREIATARLRSPNTVKTQLRAILKKTGTRSQGELLCMVTALAHVCGRVAREREPAGRPCGNGVALRDVRLADGRVQAYVEFGARDGRPVLLLAPTHRPDFTPAIVDAVTRRDLRVVCPVRPGSWGMPRWAGWDPAQAARVHLSLMDALSLRRPVLAGLRPGGAYAIALAHRAAHRFRGLVLVETGAPFDRMSKFLSMPPWPRTLYTTGRLSPRLLLLPFRYCASDFFASAEGERRAIEAFYRDSPIDLALLRDPDCHEIARRNLAYYFEHPDQVARDIGFWVRDWSREIVDVAARIPVRFLQGSELPGFPAADLRAFCERHPQTAATIVEGAASFMIYRHPEALAGVLGEAAEG